MPKTVEIEVKIKALEPLKRIIKAAGDLADQVERTLIATPHQHDHNHRVLGAAIAEFRAAVAAGLGMDDA